MVLLHCRNQAIDNNVQQLQEENKFLLQRMEEFERQNNRLIKQNAALISNVESVKQESHLLRENSDCKKKLKLLMAFGADSNFQVNMKQGDDENLERIRECLDVCKSKLSCLNLDLKLIRTPHSLPLHQLRSMSKLVSGQFLTHSPMKVQVIEENVLNTSE